MAASLCGRQVYVMSLSLITVHLMSCLLELYRRTQLKPWFADEIPHGLIALVRTISWYKR